MVAIRLNEVAPDGTFQVVTYGRLKLIQRKSHAAPLPLVAGETYQVRAQLSEVRRRPARLQLNFSVGLSL
jgi:predicted acyl esterase